MQARTDKQMRNNTNTHWVRAHVHRHTHTHMRAHTQTHTNTEYFTLEDLHLLSHTQIYHTHTDVLVQAYHLQQMFRAIALDSRTCQHWSSHRSPVQVRIDMLIKLAARPELRENEALY